MVQRYPVCDCHPGDLGDVPEVNVIITFDSCARRCPFCGRTHGEAKNVRGHINSTQCRQGKNVKAVSTYRKKKTPIGHTWVATTAGAQAIIPDQPRFDRILWFPWDPKGSGSILDKPTLYISFEDTAEAMPDLLSWFKLDDIANFEAEFGEEFVYSACDTNDNLPVLHQALVTMQILREKWSCDIDFWSWSKFKAFIDEAKKQKPSTLSYKLVYNNANMPSNGLVLFHWNRPESVQEKVLQMAYNSLTQLEKWGGSFRCFPNQTEAFRTLFKIGDIIALDEIATKDRLFRPITCYPHGKCKLLEHDLTVHKRAKSCGGHHVVEKEKNERQKLSCTLDQPSGLRLTEPGDGIWFHQEHISTYETIGEFRVFITAIPDARALRGRRGEVALIGHTMRSKVDGKVLIIKAAELSGIFQQCGITVQDLRTFSLRIYEQLRSRHDWEKYFESLEVGVRLDITLSPDHKSLFVGEITRIWCADFLSQYILPQPKYYLCEKIAESMSTFLCPRDK